MSDALLLLPDFALIVLGWLICRHTPLNRPVWDGAERLVYYVLFPALLFNSILRYPLALGNTLPLAAGGLAVVAVGVAAAYALHAWPGVDARLHASGAQTAFRFNSYVALAMAERLEGTPGVAWMALIMSVCIPVCNVAAVAGLLCNLLGVRLPALADVTLARMGAAALPLGLMAVGAGLQFGALREGPKLAAALMSIRHALMPAAALALILATTLPRGQQAVLMAFAAMPTASSAYVLAARMGGNGPYTAGLVTLSTLIGMVALPAWLVLWRALSG